MVLTINVLRYRSRIVVYFHVCYLCCVVLICYVFYVYIKNVVRISNFVHIIIDDDDDVANYDADDDGIDDPNGDEDDDGDVMITFISMIVMAVMIKKPCC